MSANLSENYLYQVLLLLIVAILCWLWMRKGNKLVTASLPPGPRGLPIAGYLPFLGKNLHHQFTKLAEEYGPIYKLWLGSKLCIVVSSPSLAKQVCRDLDVVFSNRDPTIAALTLTHNAMDIAWSSSGPYWRNIRKLFVREMLSNSNIDACYHLRRQQVMKTIKHLHDNCGFPVEIGKIAFMTEFNAFISMIWGGTTSSSTFKGGDHDDDGHGAEFHVISSKFLKLLELPNISDFFPILARFDLQGVQRQANEILAELDAFLNSLIDTREKEKAKNGDGDIGKKDFLQILLDLKYCPDSDIPINKTQMKALIMDILVGGTDTSATAVEWAMAELLHNPEMMKRVQEEITQVVGDKSLVEETHLPKFRYLDAVVKETLRLHPPLPLNVPRRPSETCIVGGYSIPKDCKVFLNTSAIQRDPDVWENPLEFRPERFLGGEEGSKWDYNGNNLHYFPFGSGRRVCAGIPLAEKMVSYILASLLHSFDWHLPQGGEAVDFTEEFGIVVKKKMPLLAVPMQRLSDEVLDHV
ncbi:flavonoid 3'-monooxygenase CYP75B137-like isoform X2 [Impatiens glandulifera]|uniref:flavonoid 3'-monooxygenase CYP75B137-like isoform X2 n=1 Tax=Impatiens glandulifera TaxID=253017 RepID=UPI001FB15530|nr:flavonoid 3'-monooxygenase CYP75B137-like isoform X2 [Impatiens glandulifera]